MKSVFWLRVPARQHSPEVHFLPERTVGLGDVLFSSQMSFGHRSAAPESSHSVGCVAEAASLRAGGLIRKRGSVSRVVPVLAVLPGRSLLFHFISFHFKIEFLFFPLLEGFHMSPGHRVNYVGTRQSIKDFV